jgi:hypothetical protein
MGIFSGSCEKLYPQKIQRMAKMIIQSVFLFLIVPFKTRWL